MVVHVMAGMRIGRRLLAMLRIMLHLVAARLFARGLLLAAATILLLGSRIGRNRSNDDKVQAALLASGWRVGVVWECALRGANRDIEGVLQRLVAWLKSDAARFEERG